MQTFRRILQVSSPFIWHVNFLPSQKSRGKILRERNYRCNCLSRCFLSCENRSVRYLRNLKCKSTGLISRNRASRCKVAFFHAFPALEIIRELSRRRRYFAVFYAPYHLFLSHSPLIFIAAFANVLLSRLNWKSSVKFVVLVARWRWINIHRFDQTTRVFRSSQTTTKGEVRLCTSVAITPTACIRSR